MKISDALLNICVIQYPESSPPVVETAVETFSQCFPDVTIRTTTLFSPEPVGGVFNIAVASGEKLKDGGLTPPEDDFIYLRILEDGSGTLITSRSHFLYSFLRLLLDSLTEEELAPYAGGKWYVPAFKWQRISYDYFLTQEGRIQRGLARAAYVKELARLGFTHIEVNGLAYPMSLETCTKGEIYPMFYTYCPALDQFVSSRLNKGLYPQYYLAANLKFLKENARLARKYGLSPGLLCFEPRSVPEQFFQRYPMLRGARVDHPFRSFKPRYNMTIAHPKVREHYAEMMNNLMREVPELSFLAVWSNDSGAGFEHTKSLYVGRNGGAYLIREWKDDGEIARVAGENALRFFRLLRDAASEVNPEFRVITRLESFYGEHETVWDGLEDGIDAETASLIARGWETPYTHPQYIDSHSINAGTVYQNRFDQAEKPLMDELDTREARAHFYFTAGPHTMFEPLLGVPYPFLTFNRLKTLRENGVQYLAHCGGISPPELVPYNINHEIVRRFQYEPEMNIEDTVASLARKWAGEEFSERLIEAWRLTEEALLAFPNVTPLYSTHGFTWYRLWVRPLVPDYEALAPEERAYYEAYMCTTPHNPNNVDLSRDVLFRLTSPEKSWMDVERMDGNVWPPMNQAVALLEEAAAGASASLSAENVIHDQMVRLKALRCWLTTQRSVAAWIAGVYGYMGADDDDEKAGWRGFLKDAILKEIDNTEKLISLFDTGVEFMALTDRGETPLIHGDNLKELLPRRIELMQAHIEDEPRIDFEYTERQAGKLVI